MSVSYHRTVCFITSVLLLTACGRDVVAPVQAIGPSAWELDRIGAFALPAQTAQGTVLADSLDLQAGGVYKRVLRLQTSPGVVQRLSSSGTWSAVGNSVALNGSVQGTQGSDHTTLAVTWHSGELSVYQSAGFQLF